MIILNKTPHKDFLVLNLSDPQLGNDEWDVHHPHCRIFTESTKAIVDKIHPDLITVTGDLSWAGNDLAYDAIADFLDSLMIPWAPVWGNHDNQGGGAYIDSVVERYLKHPYCRYEKGDPALGNGNYVIGIREGDTLVEGLILMDSHDRVPYHTPDHDDGKVWAKLIPEQLIWYQEQVKMLQSQGCQDSTLFMHIPIYAYQDAWQAAFRAELDPTGIDPQATKDCWNPGYENSFGVRYEGICSYPEDEGAFAVIQPLGHTHHIVSGHDHVNNFVIPYGGVKFVYSLKAGAGCYWNPKLNGGTVLRITENGVADVWHEFVDPTAYMGE